MKKIALITGAGSGIGKDAALRLAEKDHHVIICGRRLEPLQKTLAEASQAEHMQIKQADVSDPRSVERLFEELEAEHGRLDLLFNNAGIGSAPVPFEELTVNQWKQVVDINLSGSFYCAQAAFRLMKKQNPQGGRIINNGSISAHVPRPNSAPYTATKHAITGLTRSISLDGRKYHIACGQIDIGNALTSLAEKMTAGVPQADGSTAIEPTMDVSHVSEAILYMASLPLDANVPFMTVMANGMPYIGRG
ncbi:MAG: SDR family oxidoreductase [Saprospiraceae bacterium]|nr:SDR family oxidoreductase [Saprospiraceae bacterium]